MACVYMAESVKVLPEEIQELIEVHEWDMRTREGVERFRELKAKSLPSVALDGDLVYESLIPDAGGAHRRDPSAATEQKNREN